MGGTRENRVRVGEVEPDAAGRQRVEVWCACRAAVTGERVRAQCVDGHEKNVLVGAALELRGALAPRDRPDQRTGAEGGRGH